MNPSPVIALNRAIALAELRGPAAGLAAMEGLSTALASYHLFHAAVGEMRLRLGDGAGARTDFNRAVQLTSSPAERRFLERRLAACGAAG